MSIQVEVSAQTHTCEGGNHSYSYKATKTPTVSATGALTGTCSFCAGTTTVTLPKLNTTDYSYQVTKAATCTENGTGRYTWKITTYGNVYCNVTIAKLGHSYSYKVTAPTCTEQGYTTHTCACGDSYIDSYVDATGHTMGSWYETKAPTCTEKGSEQRDCANCDHSETRETEVKGHSYTEKVTAPTCTERGYTTHTCSCGDSYVDSWVNAIGHRWNSGVVTKEPTESEEGIRTYTCTVCHEEKTESIPALEHKHSYTAIVTAPTCTEAGYTTHTCRCGDSYVDSYVSALWHTEVTDKAVEATCTASGLTEGKHCSVCGEVLVPQKEVPSKGHSYTKKVTAPTCSDKGYTTHTCHCGNSYVDGYVNALGHDLGEWETVKEPNYLENGLRERQCIRCEVFESEEIHNNPFTDVGDGNRFKTAILWAYYSGVTKGKTDTTFDPDTTVNRAQEVTFLWRAAGSPEPSSDNNPFTDVGKGAYYYKAVLWAVEKGITKGTTATTFSPDDLCARRHIIMFLYRYAGTPDVSLEDDRFEDVTPNNSFYKAVMWAIQEDITSGKTPTSFGLHQECTRAQVVTFLYRYLEEQQ